MSYTPVPQGTPADTITGSTQVGVNRAVGAVKTLQGTYVNAPANGSGVPLVDAGGIVDALGVPIAAQLEYIAQADAVYGLQGDMSSIVSGTGATASATVTSAGGLFTVASGTSSNAYVALHTKNYLHYSSGQAACAMGSAMFGTTQASSLQFVGPFNPKARFGLVYDGSTLRAQRATGGTQEVRTLTVTAAATSTTTVSVQLNGATAVVINVSAGDTTSQVAAKIAAGSFPNWTATATGAVVTFVADWRGTRSGAYAYTPGTSGTTASFAQVVAGADFSTNTLSALNGDALDGTGSSLLTLTTGKLYVFLFTWAYLGVAPASIYICGDDGRWHLVHRFGFPGDMTAPNFSQPSFHFGWIVEHSGNTTSITLQGASAALAISGPVRTGELLQVAPAEKTGISSGANFTPLLSLRGASVFSSQVNYNIAYIDQSVISAILAANQSASFVWVKNATLTGAAWTAPASGSMVETDTTATALSGGSYAAAGAVSGSGNATRTFSTPIALRRGDTLTLAVRVTSGANYTATASVAGRET